MQYVPFVARVLVVLLAILLLPGFFSEPGASSPELCAAEDSGCVFEFGSYCDYGDDWLVDRYRKDD